MKEAIKQILKDNAWEMEKDRYVIGLSNIDDIAEEVVKLFLIPPVIKSVCDHRNYRAGHSPFVACICNDCGEEL
jgi:hypothetical protein